MSIQQKLPGYISSQKTKTKHNNTKQNKTHVQLAT